MQLLIITCSTKAVELEKLGPRLDCNDSEVHVCDWKMPLPCYVLRGMPPERVHTWSWCYLIALVESWHGDAGGGDGCQVRTDLVKTEGILHPLLGTVHQHLLELERENENMEIIGMGMGE